MTKVYFLECNIYTVLKRFTRNYIYFEKTIHGETLHCKI